MVRGVVPCAFHHRPLVSASVGLGLGVWLGCSLNGTAALCGACLFCCLALLARRFPEAARLRPFLWGVAAGLARMGLLLLPLPNGALSGAERMAMIQVRPTPPASLGEAVRALAARCDALFLEASPLARAILLGDKAALSYFQTAAFRYAGASHVLALSGLHVSALAGALLLPIPKRFPALRALAACLFLTFYCALAGFPSSLMRAAVMTLPPLFAPLFCRRADTASSLALSFLFIVLLAPMRMFSAGFCLSFSAVAGIAMFYPRLMRALRRLPQFASAPLAVTLAATLGTLPFTLSFFGAYPAYSPLSNLLIVPVMSLGLVAAFVALALSFLWLPLGTVFAVPARLLLSAGETVAEGFSRLPGAVWSVGEASPAFVLCFFAALMLLSRFCLLEKRTRLAGAGVLLLFCLSLMILA